MFLRRKATGAHTRMERSKPHKDGTTRVHPRTKTYNYARELRMDY
jgi:hypothetical protein